MFKKYIQKKLEKYVQQYFLKHPEVKLVIVAGSVGKTSTKTAIATLLSERYRVRLHEGNHNSPISAPVAILGIDYPEKIHSIFSWLGVFRAARQRIKQPTDVDVIVQELGIDRVGEMAQFGRYLQPDIGVITAVTAEHMEFFGTLDAVAQEELQAANFSKLALINRDDIEGRYAATLTNPNIDTYGTSGMAEYRFEIDDFSLQNGYIGTIIAPELTEVPTASVRVVGEHSLRPVMGAVAVAVKLGLTATEIVAGMGKIRPVPGRMNALRGVEETTLIDDTYNSSPLAAISALQALYALQTPQRIAVLGSMNELGTSSAAEHTRVGNFCDPALLAWVVTVGREAANHLAPAARARGCQVKVCSNALEAGAFVHSVLEKEAAILFKGSQGDIFLEEAVKVVLHETHEEHELVRQEPSWMKVKMDFFQKFKDV